MGILKSLENMLGTFSELSNNRFTRRSWIAGFGTTVFLTACGSDGGHGGNNPTPPPPIVDTIAPGRMDNLESYASVNNGEEARLRWVSSGDDDWIGTPSYFEIRYSANPINNETDWENASSIGTVTAVGPSGTQYDQFFPVPTGAWYFSIKAVDEANNESPVSNSPTATIKSKPEFYVNYWFPVGSIFLNYNEAVAMVQGETGVNPSYVSPIAAELIKCSSPAWPGTITQLEDFLSRYTNGNYDPGAGDGELHIAHDPWYFDNDGIGNPKIRLYFEPDGSSVNDFNNLPSDAVTNLRNIMKQFLIQHVDAHKADYGNLDIIFNPTWATWE
ncbi:hypothetical protein COV19_07420 [Candidatus Woesearchaeota archaeon CG10_big_fil_rev_8_21_14_0_10_44_13]|nr:MAG: hypothetical protein COV19_07420 [Candidatus Woesearchaeota archaeon CG10_big_fil_rev_8_21_14_0_10_44_13]